MTLQQIVKMNRTQSKIPLGQALKKRRKKVERKFLTVNSKISDFIEMKNHCMKFLTRNYLLDNGKRKVLAQTPGSAASFQMFHSPTYFLQVFI